MTEWKLYSDLWHVNFTLLFHTNLISFQNESWQSFREWVEEVGIIAIEMPVKVPNP